MPYNGPLPPQDYTDAQFFALCARQDAGEIEIDMFGIGSSPALWRVRYRKVVKPWTPRKTGAGFMAQMRLNL